MKTFGQNLAGHIKVLLLCGLFLAVAALPSEGRADETTAYELNASVMEIDLGNNLIVVAEKEIHLLSRLEDGVKKWETVFKNDSGREISVNTLQVRDNVLIKGNKSTTGILTADEVTLLPAEQESLKKGQVKQQPESAAQPSSTPVRLEGGVWKN